jgi:predicted nucleotidyltransferase
MSTVALEVREREALQDFVARIRAALVPNLVELRLYGSRARGEAADDSDIDVLVVVSKDRIEAEDVAVDVAFDVNVARDVYISPRVVTADVFQHPVWRTTLFVQTLEREGILL